MVVPTSKKTILARDFRFFAALLSEMDLGNTDSREGGHKFLFEKPCGM